MPLQLMNDQTSLAWPNRSFFAFAFEFDNLLTPFIGTIGNVLILEAKLTFFRRTRGLDISLYIVNLCLQLLNLH